MHFNQIPRQTGLYNPLFEHDSCGTGFICSIKGEKTHRMVLDALEMLSRMTHRGATGADPESGDGAGILTQLPHEFLKKTALEKGITLGSEGSYGCGMLFLPRDKDLIKKITSIFESSCNDYGLEVLLWRDVPVMEEHIGITARESMPHIVMVFAQMKKSLDSQGPELSSSVALEQRLYLARKSAEKKCSNIQIEGKNAFYAVSFSSKTIVYKGMLLAPQVQKFYPDLTDNDFKTSIAVIHSRYSTNTFPSWDRAQPFRYLAHNGEINTLKGNATWMRSREAHLEKKEWGSDLSNVTPVIQEHGSDSQALDNVLELLVQSGRSLPHSVSMLVPCAWEHDKEISDEVKDFYTYQRCIMESWDGPAALAYTDGSIVASSLDRNGLRPGRYIITKDERVIMASELGVLDVDPDSVSVSGRLEPGHILLVDTVKGKVIPDADIKKELAQKEPYKKWLSKGLEKIHQLDQVQSIIHEDEVLRSQAYTREELEMIIQVMAETGLEPIGSMGNDAPLAVLSEKNVPLYSYFRQLFAQVTNPPIDPLREGCVMSMETVIGKPGQLLSEGKEHAERLVLEKPVLTCETFSVFSSQKSKDIQRISILFSESDGEAGFMQALERICVEAKQAIENGKKYLVLTDKHITKDSIPLPGILAAGAVHQYLTKHKIRLDASLFLESAEPREVHHFCVLFGYGCDAVIPYGAYSAVEKLISNEKISHNFSKAVGNYIHAIEHGIMKVLSKMGISTLMSYKGAQIFEAVGLGSDIIETCFTGTPSRVGGISLTELAQKTIALHKSVYSGSAEFPHIFEDGGFYRWRKEGEVHAWNPETIPLLQQSVRTGNYELYKKYCEKMDQSASHPAGKGAVTLRSLFRFKDRQSIPLDQVESEESIMKRFSVGAMSFGSISGQAHEAIARAMNRIGGRSNTGEGGESTERFKKLENGDSLCSKVKQVASGRFGVTTWYLTNAEEIQIKIAQGAKPGEGGQLPGHKVSSLIAKTRYTTEGVTLISPPPHHDIYSIEDLAQLILDLKNVNPKARISVKLVSEMGVGTVAAGVAKAQAQMILISGSDGGTGASPLSSIKHAGLPWELGLSETHQTLVMNGLRDRVLIQCDGGMRTGRDLAIASLLGADEFGFATSALITLGCTMLRHCHLNNCSLGVATQDERCAARFSGKSEYVENFMRFTARHLREIMARLGFRSLDEMRGRSDLLMPCAQSRSISGLDFSALFEQVQNPFKSYHFPQGNTLDLCQDFDKKLIDLTKDIVRAEQGGQKKIILDLPINNTDRAAGTMLSGHIMSCLGEQALPEDSITLNLSGTAGQSFGAWLCKGVTMKLCGIANDYVGKGLFGGTIAVKRAGTGAQTAEPYALAGNTVLYGAVSGELYIAGSAGERFCVRNSGAHAVVEGIGDHGCEYMTGGSAIILGPVGRNFAAGMSGGIAYIYDPQKEFHKKFNNELADCEPLNEKDYEFISKQLDKHSSLTQSNIAHEILTQYSTHKKHFVKVLPRDYRAYLVKKGLL